MSRISSRSFAVNSDQQQQIEIAAIQLPLGQSVTVGQTIHDDLNCNANMQQGDADVDATNKLHCQSSDADEFAVNANMQQGDQDIDSLNKLYVQSDVHDEFLVNANMQQGDQDVDGLNKLHVQSDLRSMFLVDATLQIAGSDVGPSNKVPVELSAGVSGSQGNLNNSSGVVSGNNSTAVNVNAAVHNIFGNTTDTANDINIQVSEDNSNYYDVDFSIFPQMSGNFQSTLEAPAKYIRLKYNGTATVTATVLSS